MTKKSDIAPEEIVNDAAEFGTEATPIVIQETGVTVFDDETDTSAMVPGQLFKTQLPQQADISFPFIRLAQGLTAEVQNGEAKPGQWIVPGFDAMDEIVVVPLMYTKRRELRDDDTRMVVCSSNDGEYGEGMPGGNCAKCSMAQWEKDGDRSMPPRCTFFYSYIVYDVETQQIGLLEFKRTSIQAGKSMNTLVALGGMANFGIKLGSSVTKNKRGTYYSPTVSKAAVAPEVLAAARSML